MEGLEFEIVKLGTLLVKDGSDSFEMEGLEFDSIGELGMVLAKD